MRTSRSFLLLSALCVFLVHCGSDPAKAGGDQAGGAGGRGAGGGGGGAGAAPASCVEGPAPTEVAGFSRYAVDTKANGASFAVVGDVNGDGAADLVVSQFGAFSVDEMTSMVSLSPGKVSVYYRGKDLNCWRKADVVTEKDGLYFPNQPTLADVDGDGDLDIVVAAGFFVCNFSSVGPCGALSWFENTRTGWSRHDVVPFGDDHFYHSAVLVDFDGDGTKDLVTVGEASSGAEARWFKGEASEKRFQPKPLVIGEGLGSFPSVLDIDGDGDLDVASAEYFVKGGSFAWFERTAAPSASAPGGAFTRHVINDDSLRSIMLRFVPNLYGDGVLHAVGTNHTNANPSNMPPDAVASAVFVFDIPPDPRAPWPKHEVSSGILSRPSMGFGFQAAPGVFGAGDIDGDGDIDLAVSGDGDPHTYWMEQTKPSAFTMHVIEDHLGQASGAQIVDLDGDGKNEIVFTGYEDNAVYVYTRKP